MTIKELNLLSEKEAKVALSKCCGSSAWVSNMVASRPFMDEEDLKNKADENWNKCTGEDVMEAFDHHPKIGDLSKLKSKFESTAQWAEDEQKSVKRANDDTIIELSRRNLEYQKKFGYIFIVFASGKSASEMLDILKKRLNNNKKEEIVIAMAEQHKITISRLEKLLA